MLKSQSVHDADTFYMTSARSILNRTREKQLKCINNSIFRGYVMLFRSSARDLLELCATADFSIHYEFHLKKTALLHYPNVFHII